MSSTVTFIVSIPRQIPNPCTTKKDKNKRHGIFFSINNFPKDTMSPIFIKVFFFLCLLFFYFFLLFCCPISSSHVQTSRHAMLTQIMKWGKKILLLPKYHHRKQSVVLNRSFDMHWKCLHRVYGYWNEKLSDNFVYIVYRRRINVELCRIRYIDRIQY